MFYFKKKKYSQIIAEAENLADNHEFEEAVEKYNEAFKIMVNVVDYIALGYVYMDLKDYDSAANVFNDLVEKSHGDERFVPYMDEIYYGLGLCYDHLNNIEEALQNYEKAIEYNPKNPDLYTNCGMIYEEIDENKANLAYEYYKKAIEIDPSYLPAYSCLAWYTSKHEKYEEALEYNFKILELVKDDVFDVYYNIGVAYDNLGNIEMAEHYYLESIKSEHPQCFAYYNLGIIYKNKKEYEKSKLYYLKAIECKEDYYDAWYNLACVHSLSNDINNAIECLKYLKYKNREYLEDSLKDQEFKNIINDERYKELFI